MDFKEASKILTGLVTQSKINVLIMLTLCRFLIAGSDDMTARIFSVQRCAKLIIYTLSGHKSPVFAKFLSDSSLDCVTIGIDGEVRLWSCDTDVKDMEPTSKEDSKKARFSLTKK